MATERSEDGSSFPVSCRPGSSGSPGPLPVPGSVRLVVPVPVTMPHHLPYTLPDHRTPPPAPIGGPHPPLLVQAPVFFDLFQRCVLAGGLASSMLEGQGMFRRWRLTPLHRHQRCRKELLSSVCCHIGDFNFVSDLSVCPNALPLAALHRTNSRTLSMFTRFIY